MPRETFVSIKVGSLHRHGRADLRFHFSRLVVPSSMLQIPFHDSLVLCCLQAARAACQRKLTTSASLAA